MNAARSSEPVAAVAEASLAEAAAVAAAKTAGIAAVATAEAAIAAAHSAAVDLLLIRKEHLRVVHVKQDTLRGIITLSVPLAGQLLIVGAASQTAKHAAEASLALVLTEQAELVINPHGAADGTDASDLAVLIEVQRVGQG